MSGNNKHNAGAKPGRDPSRARKPVCPDSPEEGTRLIRQAREVVYRTPEVRLAKVAQLKEAIERGAYEIDSRQIAEILLREWFPRR